MRLTQAFWGLVQDVKLEVHPKLEGKPNCVCLNLKHFIVVVFVDAQVVNVQHIHHFSSLKPSICQ